MRKTRLVSDGFFFAGALSIGAPLWAKMR